ncbi:MAG: hypothetical protein Q9196_007464, partial [Gyalolechia fulgens]
MARKMIQGGTIEQSRIPYMDVTAPTATASLEEFFTMISAGLVGSTPHMVSASITALTRVLYEFHTQLRQEVVEDLVSTLDLFLESNNREIVRSCLGFAKVVVVSLPQEIVRPRLKTLVPGLLGWSREHKNRVRARVKHVLERAVRRFGAQEVERWCPEEGKKLIANIRKSRERKKRKRSAEGEGDGGEEEQERGKGRFESEFDEAVYGSEDDDSHSASSDDGRAQRGNVKHGGGGKGTYIIEDPDEPLDLLDRSALGRISTSKPVSLKQQRGTQHRPTVNVDGKLVFGGEEADKMLVDDADEKEPGDGTLEGGIGAYVEAIRGRDA